MSRYFVLFLLLGLSYFSFAGDKPREPILVKAWETSPFSTVAIPTAIDTGLLGFQITIPVFQKTISASFPGNTGLPALSDLFINRNYLHDFFPGSNLEYYFHSPENLKIYNTKRPYTRVGFTTAGPQRKNEKIISILHTQNVDPGFNVGFLYDNISSDGQYARQTAKTNALSLFANLKREKYVLHATASFNSALLFENGGLTDERDLSRTDLGTELLPVRLNNARSELRNSRFMLLQKYGLFGGGEWDSAQVSTEPLTIPGMRLGHRIYYERNRRSYTDNNLSGLTFYPDYFIDSLRTSDSLYFRTLRNDFFIEIPELRIKSFSFGADAGVSHEISKTGFTIIPDSTIVYQGLQPVDTVIKKFSHSDYSSYSVFGHATTSLTERVVLNAFLRYYFAGYRQNDFEFQAYGVFNIPLFKRDVILEPFLKQVFYTPSYFLNRFSSNHFIWNNNFRQTKISSLGGKLYIPEYRFRVGAQMDLFWDYVYFNQVALPQQADEGFEVFTITFDKDFRFWKFNLRSRIALQKATNTNILHFPELVTYHSLTFTQELFKKALTFQAGIDLYFNTEYYVPAYQPATSQFYLQNAKKFGNYPYLDGFINFSINRTRIFVKAEHFNAGYVNYNYFSVLNHPRNGLVTRLGLVWNFYD